MVMLPQIARVRCGLLSVQTLSTSTFRVCVYCIVLHSWVGQNVSAHNSILIKCFTDTRVKSSVQYREYTGPVCRSFKHSLNKRKGGGGLHFIPWKAELMSRRKLVQKVSGRKGFFYFLEGNFSRNEQEERFFKGCLEKKISVSGQKRFLVPKKSSQIMFR